MPPATRMRFSYLPEKITQVRARLCHDGENSNQRTFTNGIELNELKTLPNFGQVIRVGMYSFKLRRVKIHVVSLITNGRLHALLFSHHQV